ncbi:MAG: IPT/TIG domain-containing protein [Anaerolineae bacterium]|nr:IPT/TIG domain-containing protein [Anaerolineae bacterium]
MENRQFAAMGVTMALMVMLTALLTLMNGNAPSVNNLALASPLQTTMPTVTDIAPDSVPNDLDTSIVITGTGFTEGLTVTLGSMQLSVVGWVSASVVTATVPWGMEPGVHTLTVTNPGGEAGSLPDAFTITQGMGVWNSAEMYGGHVDQVAVHPLTSTTVYALAPQIGLFRSDDGGDHWSPKLVAPPVFASLAVDPLPPHWLYVGGVARSQDGGDTWTPMENLPPEAGASYYVHPLISGTLYSSNWWPGYCESAGLWKSIDYGQTWITITHSSGLTDTCIYDLAFHPTDPQIAVAAAGQLYRTSDGGTTWSQIWGMSARPLAFNPFGAHELWISTGGTWKSTNPDYTAWTQVVLPPEAAGVGAIEFAPAAWGSVYSGTVFVADKSFYKTTDGGSSWQAFGPPMPPGGFAWGIALHPTDPNIIYLSGSGEGVYRTTDGGATWEVVNQGLTAMAPRHLSTVASQPDLVYALITGWEGIFKGTRGGQAWQFLPVPGADTAETARMAVDPFTPMRLYRSGNARIFRSDDGGQTWPITGTLAYPDLCAFPGGARVEALLVDPLQPGVLLAGATVECDLASHERIQT